MGLCKCPKRKVTNQFCFEHRVNVCEFCMVSNHSKCVIQSYVQWLQDSDCNPVCTFCLENLSDKDCVRLTCYHVYHWDCLNSHARSLIERNPSANLVCPTCKVRIIPQSNLVSPVADVLRDQLSLVNWARPSLGLPLLVETPDISKDKNVNNLMKSSTEGIHSSTYSNHGSSGLLNSAESNSSSNSGTPHTTTHTDKPKVGPPYSVVNMDSGIPGTSTKKIFEAYDDPKDIIFDHDENKYKRRSAFEWFLRWWRVMTRPTAQRRNTPGSIYKRYALIVIMCVIGFIFVIMIFSWLGKMVTDGDPSYNAINNPMINVNDKS